MRLLVSSESRHSVDLKYLFVTVCIALKGHTSHVNFIQAEQLYQPLAGIKKGPPVQSSWRIISGFYCRQV